MPIYVIADLHGRFDLLCRAIDRIEADAGSEGGTLVVLGDFVDRGPQARNIIDLLMAGPQRPNWQWIVLQGNHEAMMLEVLGNPMPHLMRWWIGNGGGQTLQSYGYRQGDMVHPLKVPPAHMKWLASLPVWHEDDHHIFVHAGVPFDKPVAETSKDTLQWMLYPGDVDHADAEFHDDAAHISGKHIVHGHHQSASHPLLKEHRTNLDSFAWATGRLAVGIFGETTPGVIDILEVVGPPIPP
jgi:serine/threonine protein phosphatase 1